MKCTKVGTYLYAIGSSEEGARLAGINVGRWKIFAFGLSGLLTGLGSMIQFQHLGGSVPLALNLNTMVQPLVAIVLGNIVDRWKRGSSQNHPRSFGVRGTVPRPVYLVP